MPITGSSLWHATLHLCEHLNRVLETTVTQARLVPVEPRVHATRIEIAFRQGGQPIDALLAARFGPLRLYLGQVCDGVPLSDGQVRLRTISYKYTLTAEDLVRRHPVRTLDAIHLAAALTFRNLSGLDVPFATADMRQREAAERTGLSVVWAGS